MTDTEVEDFLRAMSEGRVIDLREWLYRKFTREAVIAAIQADDDGA
jgi:hypothetical protein